MNSPYSKILNGVPVYKLTGGPLPRDDEGKWHTSQQLQTMARQLKAMGDADLTGGDHRAVYARFNPKNL